MKKTLFAGFIAVALILFSFSAHATGLVSGDVLQKLLGGALYLDTNLSINENQGCVSCHHPSAGFADPANRLDPESSRGLPQTFQQFRESSQPGVFVWWSPGDAIGKPGKEVTLTPEETRRLRALGYIQ